MAIAHAVDRLVHGSLLGLVAFWLLSSILVRGSGVPDWLLPLSLLGGLLAARSRPRAEPPPAPARQRALVWLAIGVAAAAVTYGALATPSRHWDGAASFDAKVFWLTQSPSLQQPFFAVDGVFHHSPDYPLLQPLLVAMVDRLLPGAGRAVLPGLYLLLCGVTAAALRARGARPHVVAVGVLAVALTPALLTPGGGAVDSGYSEILVLLATTTVAAALLGGRPGQLALGIVLAVAAKPEGALYAVLAVGVAFASGRRPLLLSAVLASGIALALWVPVQDQLLHGGAAIGAGSVLAGTAAAAVLAVLADAWVRRRPHAQAWRWALVTAPPSLLLLCLPLLAAHLPAAPGALALYLGRGTALWQRLADLPAIAGAFVDYGILRPRLGATLLLPLVLGLVARQRRVPVPAAGLLGWVLLGLVTTVTPFLLSPETDLRHHLRASLPRLQSHWIGPLWLLSASWLDAVLDSPARGQRGLYRLLVPAGSRRDRVLWITKVTLQKLREGPGPWLRAVRKGIYQLLPAALQRRILHWTGADEFFRRTDVRHAAADDGIERPGLVSVVLPVFDQADLVAESIASVLAQTWSPLELIVIDDGSRDGLHAVLRRYAGDPRVRLLVQPNQGLPKALSSGFEFATGEFFTWTSADNVMHQDQLARLVAFLRAHPDVAMVYADYEVIDKDGQPLVGGEFRVLDRTDNDNPAAVRVNRSTHDLNRYEDNFIGGCFLYRAQVGRLLGDYNPVLGLEDYDYWMRINRLFRIEHLGTGELLYRYRVHENTLSARARELRILERARMLMDYERDRAAWQRAPLRILADDASRAWLRGCVEPPDALAAFDGTLPGDGHKTLLVLSPRGLAALDARELPPHASIAAFFATPAEVHDAACQLRHLPIAAFAADADTAARLAVFTRTAFGGTPGPDAMYLATRYATNSTFLRATRTAGELRRAVPVPMTGPSPLRVLLQLDTFGRGGLEQVALDLATGLLEAGCAVGLLTLDGTPPDRHPEGLEIARLGARNAAAYEAMLAAGRWQLVSAHTSVFGADVARARGVPFVQTVHNSYVWFDRDQIAAHRAADPHTAAYVCVAAQALGYADLRLQLDVRKALVIENGVDPAPRAAERVAELRDELGLARGDFLFLQVASVQPAKAHRVSIHALARLRERHPGARLVCLGAEMNPVHAALLRGDLARLGVADAVVFPGHRADALRFYAAADAFLLPSFWEGCSLAVWEAIRAGLPLVLADVGAAREQLRHGDGELVAPPFASVLALDATNLDAVLREVDPGFVERLTAAMARIVANAAAARGPGGRSLPRVAERRTMARRHLLVFRWLRQGGAVAAIRQAVARAAED